MCTDYRVDGRTLAALPRPVDVLARVEPVYEGSPGWGTDLGDVREPGDLPPAARALIELVEREVGCRCAWSASAPSATTTCSGG